MTLSPVFGSLALMLGVFIYRLLYRNAQTFLSDEEKLRVAQFGQHFGDTAIGITLLLFIGIQLGTRWLPALATTFWLLFVVVTICLVVGFSFVQVRAVNRLKLPLSFVSRYLVGLSISLLGSLICLMTILDMVRL